MLEALVFFGAPFVAMLIFSGFAVLEGEPRLAGKLFRHSFYPLSAELMSAYYVTFLSSYPTDEGWRRLTGILFLVASFASFLFAEEVIGSRNKSGPTAGA
ncbi:MAG TPA: hypothetical protein VMU70_01625 [Candidatus Tyrphobacter sp.]|nr:hypothetical protein [Candidatus Tyrphobacter sp.]